MLGLAFNWGALMGWASVKGSLELAPALLFFGSGAVLGELAVLGDGRRTATLRAVRASRVAVLAGTSRLAELALARRTAG